VEICPVCDSFGTRGREHNYGDGCLVKKEKKEKKMSELLKSLRLVKVHCDGSDDLVSLTTGEVVAGAIGMGVMDGIPEVEITGKDEKAAALAAGLNDNDDWPGWPAIIKYIIAKGA
jgi:hypothetical protein